MDRRKIIQEKEITLRHNLNSEEINIELASKIEEMMNLKEIIKAKAASNYISEHQNTK